MVTPIAAPKRQADGGGRAIRTTAGTVSPARMEATSSLGYRPELDGIRGVAILLVMAIHLHNWPRGGFLGVDVFFTLSGFLITTLLLEEWNARGAISLRAFYARRALRLFPAVAVLLAAYTTVALLLGGPYLGTRLAGVGYGVAYVANWPQAYHWPFPEQEIGFLWTLAIEEQYYLLWPGLLFVALAVARVPPRRLIVVIPCLVLGVWAWRLWLLADGADGPRIYFGTDTRLDQLLIGAAVAAWFVHRPPHAGRASGSRVLRLAGWAGVLFLAWRLFDPVYFRAWYPAVGIAAIGLASAAVIACVVTRSCPWLRWTFSWAWLRWVGTLSYSLYLWHVPAIRLVDQLPLASATPLRVLAGLVLSFLFAAASYRYVEQPFLRRRRRHEQLRGTKADVDAHERPPA